MPILKQLKDGEERSMTEKTGGKPHFVTNFRPQGDCCSNYYDKLTPKSRKGKMA
jgi:hypothetical protein